MCESNLLNSRQPILLVFTLRPFPLGKGAGVRSINRDAAASIRRSVIDAIEEPLLRVVIAIHAVDTTIGERQFVVIASVCGRRIGLPSF